VAAPSKEIACWGCGFESRREHGCLTVLNVVCCQVEVCATVLSLVQRSPTECVCVGDREAPLEEAMNWNRVEEPQEITYIAR
jgi:hypothetical protein